MVSQTRESTITKVPPSFATLNVKDGWRWLEMKRKDDAVEDGLWRIHNTLYDLTEFVHQHPGGEDWIQMTKGHDITEAVETHHVFQDRLQPFLRKYKVRDTDKPRNSRLTFDENGFYVTLRNRVAAKLPELNDRKLQFWSKVRIWLIWFVVREMASMCFCAISVLHRRIVHHNSYSIHLRHATTKLFVGSVCWSHLHMDGHCRTQFLPSARQLSHVLLQFDVHELSGLAHHTRFVASFVSEFVAGLWSVDHWTDNGVVAVEQKFHSTIWVLVVFTDRLCWILLRRVLEKVNAFECVTRVNTIIESIRFCFGLQNRSFIDREESYVAGWCSSICGATNDVSVWWRWSQCVECI